MDPSKSPFDDPDFPSKSESATTEPSSATAIFGTVAARPAQPPEDDLLRSLLREESKPAPAGVPQAISSPGSQTPPWTPADQPAAAPVSPGGFTDMFRALATPASPSTLGPASEATLGAAPVAPSASQAPQKPLPDLANVFTQVLVQKPFSPDTPAPPATVKPGEFTQMLQTLSTPVEKTGNELSPPAVAETAKAASAPGSFTQMFNSISASPSESMKPAETEKPADDPGATKAIPIPSQLGPISPQPVKTQAVSSPGDFTQMFHSAQAARESGPAQPVLPVAPQSVPSAGPGSFTQMFSQRTPEQTPLENPLKSLRPESVPESNFQFSSSPARSPESLPPAQGGFTQLLQALNKEEPIPGDATEPLMPPTPQSPAAPNPAAGGFTRLLQTLSAEPAPRQAPQPPVTQAPLAQPFPAPPMQQPPLAAPSAGGPGEFTRIISGSALRDLQGQGAAPVPPAAAAPPGRPGLPPMQFPPPPVFPQAQMPQMPHAAAPPPMPQFQPAAFPFPQPPALPPAPAPAQSKLQQYLPLILILNIFVLLVIVLILFFVLRHK
ncbi:MAG: hypothetical protein WBX22_22945 [Silvibacterium sp.]